MLSKQTTLAVVLSVIMVMSAGCAGWGEDSPQNPEPEDDSNGETQAQEDPEDGDRETTGGSESDDKDAGTDDTDETDAASTGSGSDDDRGTTEADAASGDETDDTEPDIDESEETSQGTNDARESETENDEETDTSDESTDETEDDDSQSTEVDDDTGNGDEAPPADDDSQSTEADTDEKDESTGETEDDDDETDENGNEAQEDTDSDDADDNGDEAPTNGDNDEGDEAGDNGNNDGDGENGEQLTCDAFDTQKEAQEYFDENPEERGHLDRNNDEIPCEHLPSDNEDEEVYTLTVEADSPVTLERVEEDTSTTRKPTDGTVEFSVVEGSYTLSAEGYYNIPEELAIAVDSDMTIRMQSEDGEDIEVNVVDAETGEGIEGAEISGVCNWYYSSGDVYITGETNEEGVANAHASLPPTDCHAVSISADGYEDETVNLSVPDDDGITVELEPESEGELSVVGKNVDQEGGDTDNEWIMFRNTGEGTLDITNWTVRDGGGVNITPFSFPSMTLEPGEEVRLVTGHGGWNGNVVYWGSGRPIWNRTSDTVIVRNAEGEEVLRHSYDFSDEPPENGEDYTLTVEADSPVTLERNWEDTSTEREPTNGIVEFSVIAGEYTLSAEGYDNEVVTVEDDKKAMTPEEPETHTLVVDFELMEDGDTVTGGVVIEDENGDQVAETHMDSPGENYNTDENQYEFELPAGEYQVSGHMMGSMTMNVAPDESTRAITLHQDQAITFPVEYRLPEQEVTITVTDEENIPIEGASVEVNDETKEANEDGTVEFSLIDGEYGVSVSAAGYQNSDIEIEVDHENDTFSVLLSEEKEGELSVVDKNIDQEEHDTENEWILFRNTGDGTLDLTDWTVEDSSRLGANLNPFSFPNMTLEPGEEVRLVTGDGENTDETVYWGVGNAVWDRDGDTIIVRNAAEEVVLRQYIEAPENGDDNDVNGDEAPPDDDDEESSENDNNESDGQDDTGDEGPPEDDNNELTGNGDNEDDDETPANGDHSYV